MRRVHRVTGKLQGQTLLLVDDEESVLQGVAAMLSLTGCQTILAGTGREALILCDRQAEHLTAALLDLHLPGENPAELVAALHARRPDLPIFLTSGLPEGAAREHLGRSDVAGFLPKPFRMEQLLKTIEGVLGSLPAPGDGLESPESTERQDSPALSGVSEEAPSAAEPFERWFPRRVAEAVQRGEVPEVVLSRVRAMLNAGDDASAELPRIAAVCEIADLAGIPPGQAAAVFGALQQLPGVAQERLARRIAEAWLEGQRRQHQVGEGGG